MKIRWREYERILILITIFAAVTGDLIAAASFSTEQFQAMTRKFQEYGFTFGYGYNILRPQIALYFLILTAYAWLSFSIAKGFRNVLIKGQGSLKNLAITIIQLPFVIAMLTVGGNIVASFVHPHVTNYSGWQLLALLGYTEEPLTNLLQGFNRMTILVSVYCTYCFLRDLIIHTAEQKEYKRLYRTTIFNQVSLVVVVYLAILIILHQVRVTFDSLAIIVYIWFVPATLFVFIVNLYWILPSSGENASRVAPHAKRILLVILSCCIPFLFNGRIFNSGYDLSELMLWNCFLQLAIVTPVSWLYYRQRKDKIAAMMGMEEVLSRKEADLKFLQSQINPHFLFNALNTLYGTAILENAAKTSEGIQQLGEMMRFMLTDNQKELIAVEHEVNYLRNFINLQQLRFSSSQIDLEVSLGENCKNQRIAPMLMIPLVENAFKHGISVSMHTWIKIHLSCDGDRMLFKVSNSKQPRTGSDPESDRHGIGLESVRRRLQLLYPDQHQFTKREDEHIFEISWQIEIATTV